MWKENSVVWSVFALTCENIQDSPSLQNPTLISWGITTCLTRTVNKTNLRICCRLVLLTEEYERTGIGHLGCKVQLRKYTQTGGLSIVSVVILRFDCSIMAIIIRCSYLRQNRNSKRSMCAVSMHACKRQCFNKKKKKETIEALNTACVIKFIWRIVIGLVENQKN